MAGLSLSTRSDAALRAAAEWYSARESVAAVLVFGSQARGTASARSDLDVIFLLSAPRKSEHDVYHRARFDDIDFDVNLITVDEANVLLQIPSWQYRFYDTKQWCVSGDIDASVQHWIDTIRSWVDSSAARAHRIGFLHEKIRRLRSRLQDTPSANEAARSFFAAVALERVLLLLCELAGSLPFAHRNPVATLLKFDPEWALAEVRRMVDPGNRSRDELAPEWFWSGLKSSLKGGAAHSQSFKAAVASGIDTGDAALSQPIEVLMEEFASAQPEAVSDWDRTIRIDEWLDRALRSGADHDSNSHGQLGLGALIARSPPDAARRTGSRFVEHDPIRRRLKVILPTGGCRIPHCTFCRLPELANQQARFATLELHPGDYLGISEVAVYTDGSFFDDREVGASDRLEVAEFVRSIGAQRFVVESLPQFVTAEKIAPIRSKLQDNTQIMVSTGIQSMNPDIRKLLLGTPTSSAAIERLLTLSRQYAFDIRAFLLYGKPLLTLEEDESDIRASVAMLSTRLGARDIITINYLNVVEGTQISALETEGLYRRFDICRFRRLIRSLASSDPRSPTVLPGCVAVRTCSERALSDGQVCSNCEQWLVAKERLLDASELPCERTHCLDLTLPWGVFGDLANRRDFVESHFRSLRRIISINQSKQSCAASSSQ